MKYLIFALAIISISFASANPSFRDSQKRYTRVREAYAAKEKMVVKNLEQHGISRDSLRIFFRAFKTEKKVELWAKNSCDSVFSLIKEFAICEISGEIGPKRRVKDLQVPEGFYHISELNPFSKYYLSMKINYPNASDSIRGVKGRLGSLIYIHGDCISSGCLAMSDERIKELYVYCIEAYNSGQQQIDIAIYPARMEEPAYKILTTNYAKERDKISLWADLKKHYDRFNQTMNPPAVKFLPDGTHEIQ